MSTHTPRVEATLLALAPCLAWGLHGAGSVLLVWLACLGWFSQGTLHIILIGWTAALLLAVAGTGAASFRRWRSAADPVEASDLRAFLGLGGIFTSVTLGVGIALAGLAAVLFVSCTGAK
ncbi:MAG TPA: hypothetical protein VFV75_06335 [Candidatus Polarisedimenticolaceae bacterium]|nr:hypothetical protein [Candidatus Polarisedimenticolaceae bacterium]